MCSPDWVTQVLTLHDSHATRTPSVTPLTGVSFAGVAGPRRGVLHAHELEHLEAVEGKARVRYHTHQRGYEAAVQRPEAAFLRYEKV